MIHEIFTYTRITNASRDFVVYVDQSTDSRKELR